MGRAPCCEKKGLKRGRWTVEEDEMLVKYIEENGEGTWRSLPKNAGLLRCGKSCRLRWINYLRADLKRGNISEEEEEIIIKLHSSIGNRWSLIAAQLPGRTDNEIKNYWNSHLSRRVQYFRRRVVNGDYNFGIGNIPGGKKRRGGRTSRASMSKNSFFKVKTSSIVIESSQKQNQMNDKDCNVSIASSSSSSRAKEDSSSSFDFDVEMEEQERAVERESKMDKEEEEEEQGKLASVEGKDSVQVMMELEKMLMADSEGLEAVFWEEDECEMWPWIWEMGGEGNLGEELL